jgi:DNA-binding NarL/FixJ family response regulator
LIATIRTIHAVLRKIPPEIAQQLAEHVAEEEISAREMDVLRMVAHGKSNKIIAIRHLEEGESRFAMQFNGLTWQKGKSS